MAKKKHTDNQFAQKKGNPFPGAGISGKGGGKGVGKPSAPAPHKTFNRKTP